MKIGDLKKKLAEYSDDIEIYTAPMTWMSTVNDSKESVRRRANSIQKHKIETFEVLKSMPAPGSENFPTRIFAIVGFNEDIEDILEDDFSIDSKAVN